MLGVAGSDDDRVDLIGGDVLVGGGKHRRVQLGRQGVGAVGVEISHRAHHGPRDHPEQPAGVIGAHHADTDHANPDADRAATASGSSPRSTAAAPSTAAWMVNAIAR